MLHYFHYLVWTHHTSLVSFVLSEYKWCSVTKSVYNSPGILSPGILNNLTWGWLWFYNGGNGKFLKSLYIVGREVLTPLFYDPPSLILPSTSIHMLSTTTTFLSPPAPHLHCSFCCPFFLIGIHSMQGWTPTTRHRVTRKRSTKRLQHTGNLFRKNLQLKDIC